MTIGKRPERRVRKPREIDWSKAGWSSTEAFIEKDGGAFVHGGALNAKECRKLAIWLIHAAHYIESKQTTAKQAE